MNFDKLRAYQDYLTAWRIPGNDCMVMQDHRELYRYCSGWADVENRRPMQGDELYYFWSASKVVTTCLALRLLEEGKYRLNEPLECYLPEFSDMKVCVKTDDGEELVPANKKILIKNLFNMSAGFDYSFNTPAIEAVKKATDGRCPTREIARAMAQSPLYFEPGEGYRYSVCHEILGAFIEVVSGMKLRDYARKVLFEPLGMTDTSYNLPDDRSKLDRMAVQYNYRDDLDKYLPTNNTCGHILGPDYDSGGAGIVSTCADYMKFADAIVNGGKAANGYRVLSPATISLWRTNTFDENQLRMFSGKRDCYMLGYGYGLGVRTMIDRAAAGSLGPIGEFGWGGAAGVWVILDPDNRLALVYTQHMLNNQEWHNAPRLRNVLYACMEDAVRV